MKVVFFVFVFMGWANLVFADTPEKPSLEPESKGDLLSLTPGAGFLFGESPSISGGFNFVYLEGKEGVKVTPDLSLFYTYLDEGFVFGGELFTSLSTKVPVVVNKDGYGFDGESTFFNVSLSATIGYRLVLNSWALYFRTGFGLLFRPTFYSWDTFYDGSVVKRQSSDFIEMGITIPLVFEISYDLSPSLFLNGNIHTHFPHDKELGLGLGIGFYL